jgi:hypothetical protein
VFVSSFDRYQCVTLLDVSVAKGAIKFNVSKEMILADIIVHFTAIYVAIIHNLIIR